VLNIGASDDVLFLDLGGSNSADTTTNGSGEAQNNRQTPIVGALGKGDGAFLASCDLHLDRRLVDFAKGLLSEIRVRYPGELREGLARKWVNHPGNFFALTIQNRDQSFAVHVKGEPKKFSAPALDIKPDRGSYSRFKLKHQSQFADALRVILYSAQSSEGY
jgi:hypothetical protein